MRLEKDRLYKKQKRAKSVLQPHREVLNQEDYLSMFDNANNGGIAEQCWAKTNINKFNKSVQYVISQCTVCQEAWPLKSKPRAPYVCSRCSRDKKSQKIFMLVSCFFQIEEAANEQLTKLGHPIAHINARHSSALAKKIPSDDMSGLEPVVFLAKDARVMLTMNL